MSVDPRRARMQAARTATPTQVQQQQLAPPQPVQPQVTVEPGRVLTTTQLVPPSNLDGVSDPHVAPTAPAPASTPVPLVALAAEPSYKLKFCTVCASNNNRSMEAHLRLSTSDKQYPVISFGTGSYVRLPGPTISQPQVYNFNTTSYDKMHNELQAQDPKLYKNNGILNMLDRNRHIKWGPERFHDWVVGKARLDAVTRGDKGAVGAEGGVVDVIFTCEERCWDAVVDNLLDRGAPLNRPVHIFNVDIRDNHEEALVGGRAILELADALNAAAAESVSTYGQNGWDAGAGTARASFDERVPDILAEWQERWPTLPALWTLSWL